MVLMIIYEPFCFLDSYDDDHDVNFIINIIVIVIIIIIIVIVIIIIMICTIIMMLMVVAVVVVMIMMMFMFMIVIVIMTIIITSLLSRKTGVFFFLARGILLLILDTPIINIHYIRYP